MTALKSPRARNIVRKQTAILAEPHGDCQRQPTPLILQNLRKIRALASLIGGSPAENLSDDASDHFTLTFFCGIMFLESPAGAERKARYGVARRARDVIPWRSQ